MKPSPQSQSEAHRLAWRRLVQPQSLPPETISQLQQCAEMLAEMEEPQAFLDASLDARVSGLPPLYPTTEPLIDIPPLPGDISFSTPLGEISEDTCEQCMHPPQSKTRKPESPTPNQEPVLGKAQEPAGDEMEDFSQRQERWRKEREKHAKRREKIINTPIKESDWNKLLEELEEQHRKEKE